MSLENLFSQVFKISATPEGAINTLRGSPVEGPGGRWVPCATVLSSGDIVSSLYEVGPGHRQVCLDAQRCCTEDDALRKAIELASVAAA